jgi:uridine kinase
MKAITITYNGNSPITVSAGTLIRDIVPSVDTNGLPVLGVIANNMVLSLNEALLTDTTLTTLTLADEQGWTIYRASLSFLLAKAVHELFPTCECRVRNSIGPGLYCTVGWPSLAEQDIAKNVQTLKAAMAEMVQHDFPITYDIVSYEGAVNCFRETQQTDKLNLLEHRNPPTVCMTCCGEFRDLSQTSLVPRTGLLKLFDLVPQAEGFVLNVPSTSAPNELKPISPYERLFDVYREHIAWGKIVGITTVGQLNQAILERRASDFVQTIEALHERKLAQIADRIVNQKPRVKLVLLAGPSSAGKTTTAKRLITHLRVSGLNPLLISTDNYFLGDELNPKDEQGNLDYEHIEAMDLPRLNNDLSRLMKGEAVKMRSFNFKTKTGFDQDQFTRLFPNGIIVMEGIHSLNPRLTADVPREEKFLIYLNTLTQLGIDSSNRISTNDTRIIRRLVRDYQQRNRSALQTLRLWKSVARGEQRWIYPFQNLADAVFNSALDYELAVLKPFASPLLNQVKSWDPEYIEARRLSGMLHNFSALSPNVVPSDSILRETIGNSILEY